MLSRGATCRTRSSSSWASSASRCAQTLPLTVPVPVPVSLPLPLTLPLPLPQVRTQRRQLSAALELQKQTQMQEQSKLREQVQRQRAANQQVQGAKGFATAFVAQQNAMGRQLRLGDLKRRQAEDAVSSASGAHRRREEAAFQKARAGAMRLARADERRQATLTLSLTLT